MPSLEIAQKMRMTHIENTEVLLIFYEYVNLVTVSLFISKKASYRKKNRLRNKT